MLKQTMIVFMVFLVFVFIGAAIFFVTKDVEWFYPFEDPQVLVTDWKESWPTVTGEKKDFSIRMPTFAQHSVDNVAVPQNPGQTIRHDLYTAFGYDSTRFIMGVVYLPDDLDVSDPKSIMDADMNHLLEGDNNLLKDYQTIDHAGYPGIAFTMHRGDTLISARFVLVGHTLYQLMVQAINGNELPQEQVEFFMDSFRVGSEVEIPTNE